MSVAVGTFTFDSTDVATTEVAVTGLGFQPDGVLFFWNGQTGVGGPTNNDGRDPGTGMGFALSPTSRVAVSSSIDGMADPYESRRVHADDACVYLLSSNGSSLSILDFVSMDADGFTVVVDDQANVDFEIGYMAFKGFDASFIGSLTEPAATGNQSITGVGFQPDIVLFLSVSDPTAATAIAADARWMIGAMTPDTEYVSSVADERGKGFTDTERYSLAGECIALEDDDGTLGVTGRASFVSMDADGFTINWAESNASRIVHFIAIKGGDWALGDFSLDNSTGQTAVSGVGFEPEGLFFASVCEGEHTANSPSVDWEVSLGAYDGTNQVAFEDEKSDGATLGDEHNHIHDTDAIYFNVNGSSTPAIDGEAAAVSIDADGFTYDEVNGDPDSSFIWFIAFREIALTPRNRLVRYFHNTWTSRKAGKSIFYDVLGRIVPPEQLEEDSWSYGDGPAFPTPMKPSSNINNDRAFYHESVTLSGDPPETSVETQREGLLENVMRRISRG